MLRFGLLGALQVVDEAGRLVEVGGRQPRVLLAVLLAANGRAVPVESIAETIWGDAPPASAVGTIHSYVSRLRRRLGDEVALVLESGGYRLDVDPAQVDHRRFEHLADAGRAALDGGDAASALRLLDEAEGLWRGPALVEFADLHTTSALATRLDERRIAAAEDRMDAELALGHHAGAVAVLGELVAAHPLRERLRGQLALALYRSGRQVDALRALADAARTLREDLGIEPSRPLRELEAAILAHDPALDRAVRSAGQQPTPSVPAPARAAAVAGSTAAPAGLVGRDAELAQLVAALDESAHDARFVILEGEPGIGKTRLADEIGSLARRRGGIAVWGRADEGGAAPALWPWLPPLRALAALATDVAPALTELLQGVGVASGPAEHLRFERFDAVALLLGSVAADRPVTVLLDDLQWADRTSLDLLGFLASRPMSGVLVVATVRQLEVGRNDDVTEALSTIARRPGSRRLLLHGIPPAATAEVVRAIAPGAVDAASLATIQARSDGNPFYAIELARLLSEERAHADDVPGTVGDVIRRRLAGLPEPTRVLLGVGAVVGREVPLPLLARAAGQPLDQVVDDLEPAVVHRLLVDSTERPAELRFSHALVREVLLEDLTSLRRARLHLRVADAIEAAGAGADDAEILAEHLWRAAPVGGGRRASEALERAADVALRRVSLAAVEDLLTRAAQLRRATGTGEDDQRAELATLYRLLEVARARRYFQAAGTEALQRALDLAERLGEHRIHVTMLWYAWSALATGCRRAEADPLARELEALTRDDPDPGLRGLGLETLGVLHWSGGEITEASRWIDAAQEVLGSGPAPVDAFDQEIRFITACFQLFTRSASGAWSAEETFDRFDAMLASGDDRFLQASICGFAATSALSLGCWDRAVRYAEALRQADPELQFGFWAGHLLMLEGIALVRVGRVDAGVERFAEGRRRYTAIGGRSGLVNFGAALGWQLVQIGSLTKARSVLAEAAAELAAWKEQWCAAALLVTEAALAQAQGDPRRAASRLDDAEELATAQGAHAFASRARATRSALLG